MKYFQLLMIVFFISNHANAMFFQRVLPIMNMGMRNCHHHSPTTWYPSGFIVVPDRGDTFNHVYLKVDEEKPVIFTLNKEGHFIHADYKSLGENSFMTLEYLNSAFKATHPHRSYLSNQLLQDYPNIDASSYKMLRQLFILECVREIRTKNNNCNKAVESLFELLLPPTYEMFKKYVTAAIK